MNSPPFLFEAFLPERIDVDESKVIVVGNDAHFLLKKCCSSHWDCLDQILPREEQMKRRRAAEEVELARLLSKSNAIRGLLSFTCSLESEFWSVILQLSEISCGLCRRKRNTLQGSSESAIVSGRGAASVCSEDERQANWNVLQGNQQWVFTLYLFIGVWNLREGWWWHHITCQQFLRYKRKANLQK